MPSDLPPETVPPVGPQPQPPGGPTPLPSPMRRDSTSLASSGLRRAVWAVAMTCGFGMAAATSGLPEPSGVPRGEASGAGPADRTGSGMVQQPPAVGDGESIQRAPRGVDPGMVKQPRPSAAQADRDAASPPQMGPGMSREDDCRGPAALCKQDSAK